MSETPGDPLVANSPPAPAPARDPAVDRVLQAVSGIRYGEVRVIIQDGLIVQIERLEKQRLR